MKKFIVRATALVLLASLTLAYEKDISYTPPTLWTNGNVLLEQDLDYYTLYCDGVEWEVLDSIIGTWTRTVNLPDADGDHTCYLTVTAMNGQESAASNNHVFTNQLRVPSPPSVVW